MDLPKRFQFAGIACGIKPSGKRDYSLVVSEIDAVAVGVYTQNLIFAAPVQYDRDRTPTNRCRAVVTNSGNANACTGDRGWQDTLAMAEQCATAIGCDSEQVLVMSTGIIGEFLPMDKLASAPTKAAELLASDSTSFEASAEAITTTDNGIKVASRQLTIGKTQVTITGMAKGAGMIGPNMATMLCTVCTDAAMTSDIAQELLQATVDQSFNSISVEGHTSTNDTVLLLANGAAEVAITTDADREQFQQALTSLCIELAKMIPADGEGASHLMTIEVNGLLSFDDARRMAKTVAQSSLVQAGVAGNDPNWGRIVSACGYAGIPFDPARLSLRLNGIVLYENGNPVEFDAAAASESMQQDSNVLIELAFGEGSSSARFWASDLTIDYVRFNSEYTT